MRYIHQDKNTKKMRLFRSVPALCRHMKLKPDKFKTVFSRNKKTVYENKEYTVNKVIMEK